MRPALLSFVTTILCATLPGFAVADYAAGMNAYRDGDYETAYAALRPAAEAGDARAQHLLGELYLHGQGVAQDFASAATWFDRAAERGHAEAQASIGALRLLGLGGEREPMVGYFWIIMSAVWSESPLRGEAFRALGTAAEQLSREQKAAAARAAAGQWRR